MTNLNESPLGDSLQGNLVFGGSQADLSPSAFELMENSMAFENVFSNDTEDDAPSLKSSSGGSDASPDVVDRRAMYQKDPEEESGLAGGIAKTGLKHLAMYVVAHLGQMMGRAMQKVDDDDPGLNMHHISESARNVAANESSRNLGATAFYDPSKYVAA